MTNRKARRAQTKSEPEPLTAEQRVELLAQEFIKRGQPADSALRIARKLVRSQDMLPWMESAMLLTPKDHTAWEDLTLGITIFPNDMLEEMLDDHTVRQTYPLQDKEHCIRVGMIMPMLFFGATGVLFPSDERFEITYDLIKKASGKPIPGLHLGIIVTDVLFESLMPALAMMEMTRRAGRQQARAGHYVQ
jgi:hypothetical protein